MNNSFLRAIFSTMCVVSIFFSFSDSAKAQIVPLVEISCIKSLGYIHLSTTTEDGISRNFQNIDMQSSTSSDWILVDRFGAWAKKSIICRIGTQSIEFRMNNYHSPEFSEECGAVEDASMSIYIKNKKVASIKSIHGGCIDSTIMDVKILNNNIMLCQSKFLTTDPWMISTTIVTNPDTTCQVILSR